MTDILLDTNVLADLLSIFFSENYRASRRFQPYQTISRELARRINQIVLWHDDNGYDGEDSPQGLIISSSFAFVEIARQFQAIANDRFTLAQFQSFIAQPPPWFFISALDESILKHLSYLPGEVIIPNGRVKSIELADALHIATALSRDN
ncbi:hypothetical protein KFU94_22460 [Chloroflexi bacterium TSY]|nr:hypothetical protein [Chloroflexi bacterium TSY]